jgi:hypothetical protein
MANPKHSRQLDEAASIAIRNKFYAAFRANFSESLVGRQWSVTSVNRVSVTNLGCRYNAVPISGVAL